MSTRFQRFELMLPLLLLLVFTLKLHALVLTVPVNAYDTCFFENVFSNVKVVGSFSGILNYVNEFFIYNIFNNNKYIYISFFSFFSQIFSIVSFFSKNFVVHQIRLINATKRNC